MVDIQEEQIKVKKNRSPLRLGLIAGIIIIILVASFNLPLPKLVQTTDHITDKVDANNKTTERSWHVIWEGALSDLVRSEASPTVGSSGILEVFFPNATTTPNLSYSINTSSVIESWCLSARLGYTSSNGSTLDIAHSTPFNVLVRVRGNASDCGDGAVYRAEWLRVNITSCASLGMTDQWTFGVITRNVSTDPFIWMNFYINGSYVGGTDFMLTKDTSCTLSIIRFEAYYV